MLHSYCLFLHQKFETHNLKQVRMNGYYIFVIVVSLALAIYYFTLIQIDLHKLKRSKEEAEENISADGSAVDDTPIVPQVVSEGVNGEVNISAQRQPELEAPSEAEEEHDPVKPEHEDQTKKETEAETESETDSLQTGSANEPKGDESETEGIHDNNHEGVDDQQTTEDKTNDEQNPDNNSPSYEEGQGQTEGTEATVAETEAEDPDAEEADKAATPQTEDGLEILNITPDSVEDDNNTPEPTDTSSAFDANLIQPEFGVRQMVGPQASPEAIQKAELVNESLMKIRARGRIEHSSEVVKNLIKNAELAKTHNIATHDEISRF